jgi:hypothetical protein
MNKKAYAAGVKQAVEDFDRDFWKELETTPEAVQRSYLKHLAANPENPARESAMTGAGAGALGGIVTSMPLLAKAIGRPKPSIPWILASTFGPMAAGAGLGALLGHHVGKDKEPVTPENYGQLPLSDREERLFNHWMDTEAF